LFGNGCGKCNGGGFSKQSWLSRVKNNIAIIYILRIFNDKEEYIKVGITSKGIEYRYKYIKNYDYEILYSKKLNADLVFDIEKLLLKKYMKHKKYPLLQFEGKTECLDIKIKNEILRYVKKIKVSLD